MKNVFVSLMLLSLVGCGPGFRPLGSKDGGIIVSPVPIVDLTTYFPIGSATISVESDASLASMMVKKKQFKVVDLILPQAHAQVAQGSATVNVVYNNPSSTIFTVDTSSFGNAITVSGNDLNLGTISVSGLDDNTLRVCTGVGAPANRCNRLHIRVFTLGTAASGTITGIPGFINKTVPSDPYSLDVFAGSVLTPVGFNASALASSVTNAANIYTFTIGNGTNRIRLNQLSIPAIPIKADLSNAGNGSYEMNLVVQYALSYVP